MIKLMNSAMMPAAGHYELRELTKENFGRMLREEPFESYIGYPDTARLIENIAGVPVPVSRAQTTLADHDIMLIAKLKYRMASPGDKGKFTPGVDDFEFLIAHYRA